jgi:hypothetical protein
MNEKHYFAMEFLAGNSFIGFYIFFYQPKARQEETLV